MTPEKNKLSSVFYNGVLIVMMIAVVNIIYDNRQNYRIELPLEQRS